MPEKGAKTKMELEHLLLFLVLSAFTLNPQLVDLNFARLFWEDGFSVLALASFWVFFFKNAA